ETQVAHGSAPTVKFTWETEPSVGAVEVYRRELGKVGTGSGNAFVRLATVTHPVRTYTDSSAAAGRAYEYRLARPSGSSGGVSYGSTAAYVAVALDAPLVDQRGT